MVPTWANANLTLTKAGINSFIYDWGNSKIVSVPDKKDVKKVKKILYKKGTLRAGAYTTGDIPKIGADIIGKGGATAVSLIPLAVTAGVVYKGAKYIKKKKKKLFKAEGFYKDKEGKISATRLSPYGKKQLKLLDNAVLGFKDDVLTVKGYKLVNKKGKVIKRIDNDRLVNKIIFKIMWGNQKWYQNTKDKDGSGRAKGILLQDVELRLGESPIKNLIY